MLDQRLLRDNLKVIDQGLNRRGVKIDLKGLKLIADKQRKLEDQRNCLQSKANQIGKKVGEKIRNGSNPEADEITMLREEGNQIKRDVAAIDAEEKELAVAVKNQLLGIPNLPAKDCPTGTSEDDNIQIREWGEPLVQKGLKNHWEIGEELNLFETERSVRISQSRFITLLGKGARLERALINFMLDLHTSNGYREVLPPVLVNSASLTGSGQLPKFAEESFKCSQDDLWLTPTAEVPLTSLHRNEIIPLKELPIKYVAYSPCFRKEAGSYGRDTRGLIRLHQFNKVELYWFSKPEDSQLAHQQITKDAESVLQALELPYRVVDICTGDLGFSASRTFDLEVWLAGAGVYREISSCSTCGDFQSRRSSIRTKDKNGAKLVHTLNGSGLAVGRTMAAILEKGQQADGSVLLPKALVPYFGGELIKSE